MATIHVGTAGFSKTPVRYGKTLKFVEIELRSPLPTAKTVQRWRRELPEGFAFSVVAQAALWGERDWPLRDAAAVQLELDRLANLCHQLKVVALVLRTPATVRPGTVAYKRFRELLARVKKLAPAIVWEPQGVWERSDAVEAVEGTGAIVTADPLRDDVSGEAKVYARMRGLGGDRRYHTGKLEDLAEAVAGAQEAFVVFDTQAAFTEAGRLNRVLAGALEASDDEDEGEDEDDDAEENPGDDKRGAMALEGHDLDDGEEDDLSYDGEDSDDDEDDFDEDSDEDDEDSDEDLDDEDDDEEEAAPAPPPVKNGGKKGPKK